MARHLDMVPCHSHTTPVGRRQSHALSNSYSGCNRGETDIAGRTSLCRRSQPTGMVKSRGQPTVALPTRSNHSGLPLSIRKHASAARGAPWFIGTVRTPATNRTGNSIAVSLFAVKDRAAGRRPPSVAMPLVLKTLDHRLARGAAAERIGLHRGDLPGGAEVATERSPSNRISAPAQV